MTDQEVLDRALAALGYAQSDETVEGQRAKTWVAATFDDDVQWLETATPEQIRNSYAEYRRSVYGSR